MNKKVLIIEDNNDIRENVIEILELAGYSVSSASNGKEGVEQAFKDTPDIILCDIMMPELDGYGVLYLLSKRPETICRRKEGIQSFWQLAIQNIRQECCRIIGKNECRVLSKVWY